MLHNRHPNPVDITASHEHDKAIERCAKSCHSLMDKPDNEKLDARVPNLRSLLKHHLARCKFGERT